MSKRNRDRRRESREAKQAILAAWRCKNPKCGVQMNPLFGESGERQLRALAASVGRRAMPVHLCGHCKKPHLLENGTARLLTDAELFRLMVDAPNLLEAAERPECEGAIILDAENLTAS